MGRKRKYKFTHQTMTLSDGTVLHRIKAIHHIPEAGVRKGDLGGWVEHKNNLSQSGSCWIFGNAKAYGQAVVSEHARLYDSVTIAGHAKIYGHAWAQEKAEIRDHAQVYDNAWIKGHAIVKDYAKLYHHAQIEGKVILCGYAEICNGIFLNDDSIIHSETPIKDTYRLLKPV